MKTVSIKANTRSGTLKVNPFMSTKTARKLEGLAKFIEKLPAKNFSLYGWVGTMTPASGEAIGKTDIFLKNSACKTTACLAGWEAIRHGKFVDATGCVFDKKDDNYTKVRVWNFAEQSLGLKADETSRLFYPSGWPGYEENRNPYQKFPNTPKGAARRIRHLIRTGE